MDELRSQTPTHAQARGQAPVTNVPSRPRRRSRRTKLIVGAVVLVILVVAAGLWLRLGPLDGQSVNQGEYQAVFLTNGQVYFGKLSFPARHHFSALRDIYYLQTDSNQVQPASGSQQPAPKVHLVKLGSELHAPENAMYLEPQQILFWENIKNDGQVVKAIKAQP